MHRPPLPGSRSENRETRLYDSGTQNADLGPRIRGYWGRLLDLERIGSRGAGRMFGVLAARSSGGDGWVEAVGSVFFGGDERLATIQQIPLLAHATFLAQMESKSISSCEM